MVLSTETFNQSVRTEYSEALNARYTSQPLWVSDIGSLSPSIEHPMLYNFIRPAVLLRLIGNFRNQANLSGKRLIPT